MKLFKMSALLVLITLGFNAVAQNSKVETVRMEIESTDGEELDLAACKKNIDLAAEHPKTSNDPKMWYYKGATYYHIAIGNNETLKQENPMALNTAITAFENAIKTDSKDRYSSACKTYLINSVIALYNQAASAYQNEKYEQAMTDYNKIIELFKYDEEGALKTKNITKESVIQYSYYAAMAAENYDEAITLIKQLVDANFNDPRIYVDIARVYLTKKDTTNALKYIALGREMFENDKNLINMELDIYLKQGRSEELITKLTKAIDADPSNRIYYFARAVSYEGMDSIKSAEADYKKAVEVDPYYYDAYYNLGVMYINQTTPLIQKLQTVYTQQDINKIETQIMEFYKKAIVQFEKTIENPEMGNEEKVELAKTMKKVYGRIDNDSKVAEMEALINAYGG